MKVKIQKRDIESALVKAIPFLDSKDNSNIASNVMIELKDSKMIVSATNFEFGLRTTTECLGIEKDGTAIVNGKKLLEIIKVLKNDNVTIELKKEDLHISQSRSKFKVALFSNATFPNFPSIENDVELNIDPVFFLNSIRQITPTIDVNNPKYEFNGALIKIKSDCVDFVSTDIKRLSIVKSEQPNDKELSIIVPRAAISEIQKLFYGDFKIYCSNTYLIIETFNTLFFTKLINGKFPDYDRVIPAGYNHSISINKLAMIDSIKQVSIMSQEIQLKFSNNQIEFIAYGDNNNTAKTELDIDFVFDDVLSVNLNSKYVLDFLNTIYSDVFEFHITQENMPFVLESEDLKTIVMPISK